MTIRRIDDCLSARAGRLFIEECDALGLVRQFGSPLFVFSEDQLRRNVRRFQGAFQAGWPDGPVVVMPAAKANWLASIQRILADEGCGCDTYSAGELTMALRTGSPILLVGFLTHAPAFSAVIVHRPGMTNLLDEIKVDLAFVC